MPSKVCQTWKDRAGTKEEDGHPDGHSRARERERVGENYSGSDRCPLPMPKKLVTDLPCPALSGQVAFKVTYVGVSYESSAIIKESHSACPTAPCPAARFQPGAIISKRHACQQHSKLLCGLMVFSWLLLANTYLPSCFPAAALAPDPCHLSE